MPTSKGFRFLFVGGAIFRKGIDIAVRAFASAFTREDDVALVIKDFDTRTYYRSGFGKKMIEEAKRNRNCPEIIYLDEDLSEGVMAQLYSSCHVILHPYRGEGFCLPALEAMASGKSVVATANGSTDDFVDDGCGYRIPSFRVAYPKALVNPELVDEPWLLIADFEKLVEALRHIYKHPEEVKEKGQKARQKVVESWTWQHSAERVLQRIEALLQEF